MKSTESAPECDFADLAARLRAVRNAEPTVDNLRLAVSWSEALGRHSQVQLHSSVMVARAHGISWQSIGDCLGVSRQAAFKKFSTAEDRSTEDHGSDPATLDLVTRTEQVFTSLAADDFESVKALMTFTCSRELSKRKVMRVWAEIIESTGQFESCSNTVPQTLDGRNIVEKLLNRHLVGGVAIQTRLLHEYGEWTGRVAYNGAGKITGIIVALPNSNNLAF